MRCWDLTTQTCLRTLNVREAVRYMVVHARQRLAYFSIDWRDGASGRVICWNLDKGQPSRSAMKTRAAGPLAMQPTGQPVSQPV